MSKEVIITERGWPGHFIGALGCAFRRNTLIQYKDKAIVVSTIGSYHPLSHTPMEEVGAGRHYETMAFQATIKDDYIEADTLSTLEFNSPWTLNAFDIYGELKKGIDSLANNMHETVVKEFTQTITKDN